MSGGSAGRLVAFVVREGEHAEEVEEDAEVEEARARRTSPCTHPRITSRGAGTRTRAARRRRATRIEAENRKGYGGKSTEEKKDGEREEGSGAAAAHSTRARNRGGLGTEAPTPSPSSPSAASPCATASTRWQRSTHPQFGAKNGRKGTGRNGEKRDEGWEEGMTGGGRRKGGGRGDRRSQMGRERTWREGAREPNGDYTAQEGYVVYGARGMWQKDGGRRIQGYEGTGAWGKEGRSCMPPTLASSGGGHEARVRIHAVWSAILKRAARRAYSAHSEANVRRKMRAVLSTLPAPMTAGSGNEHGWREAGTRTRAFRMRDNRLGVTSTRE
ncbi:hypothetical protein B0H17DRAFT_1259937 [Mycena rosella]|uniref:Uncharacterized protein n=1 Tax=Mycena rosella TaxID=1033263 RepID=A0AAD7G566_MYCRO|nr:hypothetical protein B0H17DRAFT_1259937 [Mycena rosella]